MTERGEEGPDDYAEIRARRAALRAAKPSIMKRYLVVLGVIFATLIALGIWLKPPIEDMREGVDEGLRAWAAAHSETGAPQEVTHEESHDWILAVSHTARVGEATFSCWGAFKVTVRSEPGE